MVEILLLLESLFHLFEKGFGHFGHFDTFHDDFVGIGLYLEDSFVVGKGTYYVTMLNERLEILLVHLSVNYNQISR